MKIDNFFKYEEKSSNNVFNVYTNNNHSEICSFVEALEKLKKKIASLNLEFPENHILLNILNFIDKLLNYSSTVSLIQLTLLLENLLCIFLISLNFFFFNNNYNKKFSFGKRLGAIS